MSAANRGGWSPYRLPRVRRALVAALDGAAADTPGMARLAREMGVTEQFPDDDGAELRREADHLRAAELYWATRDMTRLAVSASGELPDWTPAAARPSTFGMLVWEGGLPELRWTGAPDPAWTTNAFGARTPPLVPVDAVSWAPRPGNKVRLSIMTRTIALGDAVVPRYRAAEVFAFAGLDLALLDPVPTTSTDWSAGLIAVVGATWLMMQQPTVAESRPLSERDGRTAAGTPGPSRDREVHIIDLRRTANPSAVRADDAEPGGREYRHRWMVRGHWRQQAHGPGRTARKPIYVPPHVKGPDGAPMLEPDYVHVWRR